MEEIKIEEPVMEEKKEESPKEKIQDPTEKCYNCGQVYSGCHFKHENVVLSKVCLINGVKYGPGEAVVPSEAIATWSLAV